MVRSNIVLARLWIEDADRELLDAQILFDAERYPSSCLHSHLASEKAVKALTFYKGEQVEFKHHKIGDFYDQLIDEYPNLVRIEQDVNVFRPYSTDVRFIDNRSLSTPGDIYGRFEARVGLEAATNILEAAKNIIKTAKLIMDL